MHFTKIIMMVPKTVNTAAGPPIAINTPEYNIMHFICAVELGPRAKRRRKVSHHFRIAILLADFKENTNEESLRPELKASFTQHFELFASNQNLTLYTSQVEEQALKKSQAWVLHTLCPIVNVSAFS